ncbi:hypothetical protein N865_11855 [Intrasporangium oryzae NRRL B-24470]|uniref:Uncharacterized protein n=1 Tax=Intrasporangium oryzae NRRL B-24470 TaxID=1386089 RepID=W9G6Z2_9MICO|nr:hypothetical protein N865_11855 [Intrasporangium oryzae NRRL B-24470]
MDASTVAKAALETAVQDLLQGLAAGADDARYGRSFEAVGHELEAWCRVAPRGISMKGLDGAPDWLTHEMSAWELGERVRGLAMPRLRRLQPESEVPRALEGFVARTPLGKGRQCWASFALDVGKAATAARLGAAHLDDDEVNATVLTGLRKYRVTGFGEAAQRLATGPSSRLTRREARKYLSLGLER